MWERRDEEWVNNILSPNGNKEHCNFYPKVVKCTLCCYPPDLSGKQKIAQIHCRHSSLHQLKYPMFYYKETVFLERQKIFGFFFTFFSAFFPHFMKAYYLNYAFGIRGIKAQLQWGCSSWNPLRSWILLILPDTRDKQHKCISGLARNCLDNQV